MHQLPQAACMPPSSLDMPCSSLAFARLLPSHIASGAPPVAVISNTTAAVLQLALLLIPLLLAS